MTAGDVHVLPVNDLIEHEDDGDDCPCGPRSEPVERDDGSVGWVIVHSSLDGREVREVAAALDKGGGDPDEPVPL